MPIKNQSVAFKAVKAIQEICKPLQNKALTHFFHDTTFGKGDISLLMNNERLLQFYQQYRLPAICTDESGRTLSSGVYLGAVLKEYHHDVKIIMRNLPMLPANSIHICKRHENFQELYSFFFDQRENDFLHWVLNDGNRFNDFIENYNIKANDIIRENGLPENRMFLPYSNQIMHQSHASTVSQIRLLHKDNHLDVMLATQQSRCLLLLSDGKSIKQVANEMKLSDRTISHYLTRIRQLLGCRSNRELLASYGEQLFYLKLRSRFS
jgi:DNA-binding CsgD family transcriptional regulator